MPRPWIDFTHTDTFTTEMHIENQVNTQQQQQQQQLLAQLNTDGKPSVNERERNNHNTDTYIHMYTHIR